MLAASQLQPPVTREGEASLLSQSLDKRSPTVLEIRRNKQTDKKLNCLLQAVTSILFICTDNTLTVDCTFVM